MKKQSNRLTPLSVVSMGHEMIRQELADHYVRFNSGPVAAPVPPPPPPAKPPTKREAYDAASRANREKLDEAERARLFAAQQAQEEQMRKEITRQIAKAEAAQENLDRIRTRKRLVRSRADYS